MPSWRMRYRNLLIPGLAAMWLALPLGAQDAWKEFLQKRQNRYRETAPWTLLVQGWELDLTKEVLATMPDYRELLLGHDVAIEIMPRQAARSRWGTGLGEGSRCTLLDASGQECSFEGSPLRSSDLLKYFAKVGYVPSWQARRAFLQLHPEHGEAWLAEVSFELRRTLQRREALGSRPPFKPAPGRSIEKAEEEKADAFFSALADCLEGFSRVPGWWLHAPWAEWLPSLQQLDGSCSPRLRGVLQGMHRQLQEVWGKSPHSSAATLGLDWLHLGELLEPWNPPLSIPRFTPVPGRIWPSPSFFQEYASSRMALRRWDQLLAELGELQLPDSFRGGSEEDWAEYCELRVHFGFARATACAGLGRWDETLEALEEARRWAGPAWGDSPLWERYQEALVAASPELRRVRSEQLKAVLDTPAMPRPQPPEPEPLRLVLAGQPAWKPVWERLRQTPALLRWDPSELVWEHLLEVAPDLRSSLGWGSEPRWLLYQGRNLLASDTAAPQGPVLSLLLAKAPVPRFQQLEDLLIREPDHVDAHRLRFELLRLRMPQSALERDLAESAGRAWVQLGPLSGEAWKPDPSIWASPSRRLLTETMDQIRRWPSSAPVWTVYASWLPLQPGWPTLASFTRELEVWDSRSRWAAGLPPVIHGLLKQEFERYQQYGLMREWFQMTLKGFQSWPDSRMSQDQRQERAEAIRGNLVEVLKKLQYNDEILELSERTP